MSRKLAAVGALLLLASLSAPVFGETTEILATGPDKGTGIPYLQPNVISYYAVTYLPGPTGAESSTTGGGTTDSNRIRVLFTDTAIVAYSQWSSAPCGAHATLGVRKNPPVLYYHSSQGWSLFFAFPPSTTRPCSFVSVFIERFDYFLGITQNRAISSFPAVLKIP